MNDILLIGGPTTLTGVDRINDDLLSILAEDNLHSRKAVIVWPTSAFLSVPSNPDMLQPHIDMGAVLNSLIKVNNSKLSSSDFSVDQAAELRVEASKDRSAVDKAVTHFALTEAIYRLSRLILDISGGLRLAMVVGASASDYALRWTRLVAGWSPSSLVAVKSYDTKSIAYGALNSVKSWGMEFDCLEAGEVTVRDILPLCKLDVYRESVDIDEFWYDDVPQILDKAVRISYPVESRTGKAMAVQAAVGDGFMLVMPEPDKPKNFRIGLVAGGLAVAEDASTARSVVPKSQPAVSPSEKYITVKDAAELLSCSPKTIRNYYGKGNLEHKKIGQRKVLILKSSVDKLLEGS